MPPHDLHCPNCGTAIEIPVPEQSLGEIVADAGPMASPTAVATEVLDAMLPPVPAAFLHSAVTEAVRAKQNRRLRGAAKSLLTVERDWNRDMAARQALLSLPMALGDGTKVTWGNATWEQWEQRLRTLDHLENTVLRGIRQGKAVAEWALEIKELNPGATCLNEVTVLTAPPIMEAPEQTETPEIEGTLVQVDSTPITVVKPANKARRPRRMR